jgi:hypothetical protein
VLRLGVGIVRSLRGNAPAFSSREIATLRAAGYRFIVGKVPHWISPTGQNVPSGVAHQIATTPTIPGQPPYQPRLPPPAPPHPWQPPPPLRTTPQPPRPPYTPDYPGAKGPTGLPPDKYPMPPGMPSVYKTIWAYLVASAIMYALPYLAKKAKETWDEYIGRWQDRQTKVENRRKPGGPGSAAPRTSAPRSRAPDAGRGDPFPSTPPITIIVNMPAQPPQVATPSPVHQPSETVLEDIYVPSARLPVPVVPATPLWKQLAPLALGSGIDLLFPKAKPVTKVNIAGLTDAYATGVDSSTQPLGDYAMWQPDTTATDACTCPKKKGKKRKKRTVCYRGTYTETASGLTKRKRQKVPCK